MARGYPDFFGFSIFPGPGGIALSADDDVTIDAAATTRILSITGKGTVFAGWIFFEYAPLGGSLLLDVTVDGNLIGDEAVGLMHRYAQFAGAGNLFYITRYSSEAEESTVILGEDVSFGQSFVIDVVSTLLVDTACWYHVNYYLVV